MLLKGATRRPVISLVPLDQESQGEDSPSAVSSPDETDDEECDECEEILLGSSPEDCKAEFSFWSARRDTSPQALLQEPKREPEGTPMRRLIQVDFSEFQGDIDDDDDEDLICSIDSPTSPIAPTVIGTAPSRHPNPWRRTAYDLATQCPSRRSTLRRRHTVATAVDGATEEEETALNGSDELPIKKSAHHLDPERGEEAEEEDDTRTHTSLGSCELNWSRSSLQDELLQSTHWQSAMECLSLTLEEIVHIRSVLTKAELESLPVEGRIKEEVEKRKVCFLCLKTRFSIFGPWGQKCKLCKRTVCAKCCSKMRIPTEHFSRVPVFALSPGLSSPEGSEDGSSSPTFTRSLMTRLLNPSSSAAPAASAPPPAQQRFNSVGSAPTSPNVARRTKPSAEPPPLGSLTPSPSHQQLPSISPGSNLEQPQSLPVMAAINNKQTAAQRGKLIRSKTLGRPAATSSTTAEKLKGLQMTVCLDCKAMVLQIIKTSRTSRTHAIKNLSLNLSPVY